MVFTHHIAKPYCAIKRIWFKYKRFPSDTAKINLVVLCSILSEGQIICDLRCIQWDVCGRSNHLKDAWGRVLPRIFNSAIIIIIQLTEQRDNNDDSQSCFILVDFLKKEWNKRLFTHCSVFQSCCIPFSVTKLYFSLHLKSLHLKYLLLVCDFKPKHHWLSTQNLS